MPPIPLPYYSSLHCITGNQSNCKTSCGLTQDGLFTNWQFGSLIDPWLHDLQLLILVFSALYSSSFRRTETMVFAKQNKAPISNMLPGRFSRAPHHPPPLECD